MASAFQIGRCCGKSCISRWSNQKTALRDNPRTANDSSFRASPVVLNCSRDGDTADTASERDRPSCVETSSNRHFQASAFVARLVLLFQQMPTVRKLRLNRRQRTESADIMLSAHQPWTTRELSDALCPAMSFKADHGFFSACIAATCASGTASLPRLM